MGGPVGLLADYNYDVWGPSVFIRSERFHIIHLRRRRN